jgi:hypothetical protein
MLTIAEERALNDVTSTFTLFELRGDERKKGKLDAHWPIED